MRVTIVDRYFWPVNVLVNEISKWLAADGHEVRVLTGQPDYNPEAGFGRHPRREDMEGVSIERILANPVTDRGLRRNLITLWFVCKAAMLIAWRRRTDVVWCSSIPPIVQPVMLRLASWLAGAKFVYFPQDIYPEIAGVSGMMRRGLTWRILRWLDIWVINRADMVVTISEDMAQTIRARGARPRELRVIRLFSPTDRPRPAPRAGRTPPFRAVFAGNIGRFQNLPRLVETLATAPQGLLEIHFLGAGRMKPALEEMVRERGYENVHFHPLLGTEEAFDFVSDFDIGIISLAPEIHRYAFPSKTHFYLAAGLPILAFLERDSELSRLLTERGIGIAVDPEEPSEVAHAAIGRLCEDYDSYQTRVYEGTDDLYLQDRARAEWLAAIGALKPVSRGVA